MVQEISDTVSLSLGSFVSLSYFHPAVPLVAMNSNPAADTPNTASESQTPVVEKDENLTVDVSRVHAAAQRYAADMEACRKRYLEECCAAGVAQGLDPVLTRRSLGLESKDNTNEPQQAAKRRKVVEVVRNLQPEPYKRCQHPEQEGILLTDEQIDFWCSRVVCKLTGIYLVDATSTCAFLKEAEPRLIEIGMKIDF